MAFFNDPLTTNPWGSTSKNGLPNVQIAATDNPAAVEASPLSNNKDPFWEYGGSSVNGGIDASRWNKSFPYQVMVVQKVADGGYARTGALFTLPIPPESMTITTPFAITTNVTLGGIIEEHNGAPIRTLSFNGTTGVLPLRGAARQLGNSTFDQVSSIFAGTVQGIKGTANAALDLGSNITGGAGSRSSNLLDDKEILSDDSVSKSSGYYQFRLFQNFLEKYIALKKTLAGRNARLAVAVWKDEAVYLVTPQSFVVSKTAGEAYTYNYNLAFKAWRRIKLSTGAAATTRVGPTQKDPNALARILNTVNDARRVLQKSRQTLLAVSGDVDRILFEPLRQVALFVKDAVGANLAFSEIPGSILLNARPAILEWSSANDQVRGVFGSKGSSKSRSDEATTTLKSLSSFSSSIGKDETGNGDPNISTNGAINTDPTVNSVFNDPNSNFDFLNTVKVGDVNLSPSVLRSITEERDRVRQLKRLDFENMRDGIVNLSTNFASAVGLGSSSYTSTFGKEDRPPIKEVSQQDYDALFQLNNVGIEMNRLAASGKDDNLGFNSMDFVANAAAQSGIPFVKPRSKFAIPFPYGTTLEALALRYLGTPDRWHEIAALNNLREPYVDETGFDLVLLVNSDHSTVVVSDVTNLFVGQLVWLSSNNTARVSRHITGIKEVVPGQHTLSLDGDDITGKFTTVAGATLHAFLPGTVNSQMLIYIPSDKDPTSFDFKGKTIPGVNEFDAMFQIGGADLLLTQSNDLVVTPDGDQRLAIGLANIVQDTRIRLGLQKGKLLHHPGIGLDIRVGQSTVDMDVNQLIAACRDLFADDPAYVGVTGASVTKRGPVAQVSLAVSIAGLDQTIPITVNIQQP